jgi:molybdate transport system substrate-binding protein
MRRRGLLGALGRLLAASVMVFILAFALFGCGGKASQGAAEPPANEPAPPATEAPAAEAVTLQIFAANSLEKALPEVQALYTAAHPEVTFSDSQFKASGDLVEQLSAGAAADLLITASKGTMDTAVENGSVDEATRIDMFGNDLVVVRAVGSDIQVSSLEDVQSDAISRIAIGDAATVPAGAYANQALNSIGLYSSDTGKDGEYAAALVDKVVFADKVGTAANYVATGDCQIGFVYSSDIYRYDGIEAAFVTPADSHKAIIYPGAVIQGSANAAAAADFLSFCLTDADAQAVWSKYGFQVL